MSQLLLKDFQALLQTVITTFENKKDDIAAKTEKQEQESLGAQIFSQAVENKLKEEDFIELMVQYAVESKDVDTLAEKFLNLRPMGTNARKKIIKKISAQKKKAEKAKSKKDAPK